MVRAAVSEGEALANRRCSAAISRPFAFGGLIFLRQQVSYSAVSLIAQRDFRVPLYAPHPSWCLKLQRALWSEFGLICFEYGSW